MATAADVIATIKKEGIKYVDLRFTDTKGKEQHVTVPASEAGDTLFTEGKMFDGSSIAGWKTINESDMILMPDPDTATVDVFAKYPQLNISCDVVEPADMKGYEKCPRSIAKRALEYLSSTGIADTAYFGPENEFFVFDSVAYSTDISGAHYAINSREGSWDRAGDGTGHAPGVKGGYFPVPPVDSLADLRADMCENLEKMGVVVEVHHHEVATAGQCEIGAGVGTLVEKADQVQKLKYVIHNTADQAGKTATFMPKPLVGDNGNGMHVHQSLAKGGKNVFAGDKYAGLSQEALWYTGGVIKHAKALNAFTNPGTNSYKRLVPGFEAPLILTYSARNRSASIRIPWVKGEKGKRIECRFPDNIANPYLAFTALMMAGLDGIKNKIDPGQPNEGDLYELSAEEEAKLPCVAASLEEALSALDADREFLKAGGVMSDAMIDSYIELKGEEVTTLRMTTAPVEFEMYYSV